MVVGPCSCCYIAELNAMHVYNEYFCGAIESDIIRLVKDPFGSLKGLHIERQTSFFMFIQGIFIASETGNE